MNDRKINNQENYDVIVIGGGPAGSTAATLIAQNGQRVLLLERDAEPTFKIGESLIPATYWTFKRLGILNRLRESHFPQKYSVQFYARTGKASAPFYFFETNPHESAVTWQVLRSEFDQMLLDNATENDVDVLRGFSVRKVIFEGKKATGVVIQNSGNSKLSTPEKNAKSKNTETVHGTVIVDSTGQSSLIGRQLKLNTVEPNLKKASLFTHYEGGQRDSGIDEGATLILHTEDKDSWFWSIPLPYNRTSVGVVGEITYLLQNRRDADGKLNAQKIFDEELEKCQPLKKRLQGAKQLFPIQTTKDFSYRASKIAGENWVLIGDAFGFLDPVYSTGLFLALKSGEMAADTIINAFHDNDFSETKLGCFGQQFVNGMEAFRKLVYAFYTKDFSFARFLSEYPQHLGGIVDILSGDVYRRDVTHIFSDMSKMCYFPPEVPLNTVENP